MVRLAMSSHVCHRLKDAISRRSAQFAGSAQQDAHDAALKREREASARVREEEVTKAASSLADAEARHGARVVELETQLAAEQEEHRAALAHQADAHERSRNEALEQQQRCAAAWRA